MSILDICLLALVLLGLGLALRKVLRGRGSCSCGGSCSACRVCCGRKEEDGKAKGPERKG